MLNDVLNQIKLMEGIDVFNKSELSRRFNCGQDQLIDILTIKTMM